MAAVGVDNDASVVPECANGKLPVRRSTLASKAHVDSTCCGHDRHLRRFRRHYEIPRNALLNGQQHNLTSIEVSGAADLHLLVRLVNAAGEPQRPTPDRPPHLDRTAEPLPTQLHRGRHRVERPSVVGIQPLPPFLWRTPRCPREGRLTAIGPLVFLAQVEAQRVLMAAPWPAGAGVSISTPGDLARCRDLGASHQCLAGIHYRGHSHHQLPHWNRAPLSG